MRTKKFKALCDFYEKTVGLPVAHRERGFRVYDLPNGDRIEVFAQSRKSHKHFTTGPVVGFQVDDVAKARAEMESKGIKFIGPIQGSRKRKAQKVAKRHSNILKNVGMLFVREGRREWAHFRGPDGNVYEITARKRKK